MKAAVLVILSFLISGVTLFANPFIGVWTCGENTIVLVSDKTIEIKASDNTFLSSLSGEYAYSYGEGILHVGGTLVIYDISDDGDQIFIMFFSPGHRYSTIVFHRAAPAFTPQQESFKL